MPFAEINGINLFYEIQGFGDPVLLLHHGFGCTKMWDKLVPRLVEQGYKTICYDRRGFGQSEPGEAFYEFYVSDDFRQQSVSELDAFRDWLGVDSFHLIGQCEGGVLAVDYAAQHPQHVKNVIISSTMCYSTIHLSDFNAEKFAKTFEELDPEMQIKLTSWHGEKTASFFNQFRLYGGEYGRYFFDIRPVLPHVSCPALVLYPDRSFLFEVEQGVSFYRGLSKGELAVLPKCGHNTYEEKPEEYATHVISFLARHRFGDEDGMDKDARPMTCAG